MTNATDLSPTKIRRIRRALLAWYDRNARDLPWRRTRNPYRIWLSEVMLQQTRVETVLPYYRRFLRAFPSVKRLATANQDAVLKLWEGLGYYSRARNLHRAAQAIVRDHAGRLPTSAAEWRQLPGVGRYTAGAIASIAHDEPAPILDGNVKRVLARVAAIEDPIDKTPTINRLWSSAEALVPPRRPGAFNQALMELGARVCKPRQPQCGQCPLRNSCTAHARGLETHLPVRSRRAKVPHYDIVAAAIQRNGRYLLGKRPSKGLLGGLWEFPGGKVEPGETHEQALTREAREELGLDIAVGPHVATVKHAYSHFAITLHLYRCQPRGKAAPKPRFHTSLKWVPRTQFDRYAFPAANYKCLNRL